MKRKILITGASSGFGALTVKTLLSQGHTVTATMRNVDSKNKEIAEKLDISVKTVETQMSKALQHLREQLKDYLTVLIIFLMMASG